MPAPLTRRARRARPRFPRIETLENRALQSGIGSGPVDGVSPTTQSQEAAEVNPIAARDAAAPITNAGAGDSGATGGSGNNSNAGGDFQSSPFIGQNNPGDNTSPASSEVVVAPQAVATETAHGAGNGSANTGDFNATDGTNGISGGGGPFPPAGVALPASSTSPTSDANRENPLNLPTPAPFGGRSLINDNFGLSNPNVRLNPPFGNPAQALPPSERDPISGPDEGVTPPEGPIATPREEASAGDTIRVPISSDLVDANSRVNWTTLGEDLRRFLSRLGGGEDTAQTPGEAWQAWIAIVVALIASRTAAHGVGRAARRDTSPDGESSGRFPDAPGPWPLGLP